MSKEWITYREGGTFYTMLFDDYTHALSDMLGLERNNLNTLFRCKMVPVGNSSKWIIEYYRLTIG